MPRAKSCEGRSDVAAVVEAVRRRLGHYDQLAMVEAEARVVNRIVGIADEAVRLAAGEHADPVRGRSC